jgi:hypothetical protein
MPIEHIGKKSFSSAILFVLSGMALSTFIFLAQLSACSLMAPIFLSGFQSEGGKTPGEPIDQIMKYLPIVGTIFAIALLGSSIGLRRMARRRAVSSLRDAQQGDDRAPILFLRPFYDDQVSLKSTHFVFVEKLFAVAHDTGSLDMLLLHEGTAFGPVVAVGNPDDPFPKYGASRGYFCDQDWQGAVERLANDSLCIIICLENAEGVLWELEHLIHRGHAKKTLFLFHPRTRDLNANRELRATIINRIQSISGSDIDLSPVSRSDIPVLGFFFSEEGLQVGVSNEFSEASYLLMTRWFLRGANQPKLVKA